MRRSMVSGLLGSLFGGDAQALVAHLVREDAISADDLAEVRGLLDARRAAAMAEAGAHVFAWLATAWLHGLALFAVVWAAERLGALKSLALRETAWRAVLLVPLLSAALQVFALDGSPTARSTIAPAPAAAAAAPAHVAAAPAPAAAAPVAPVAAASLDVGAVLAPVGAQGPGGARLGLDWPGCCSPRPHRRPAAAPAPLPAWASLRSTIPPALRIAADLQREAGLARLRLRDDPALSSPIALAPHTVVLPGWTRTALSERQLAALLAHEVRHLARRDPQWRALTGFAALAALAPHGRLVLRRLEALAEHACDGWSARRTGDGTPLAECIAACLERGLGARAPSLAAAMAQMDSPLLERVRRLLDDRADRSPSREDWRERLLLIGALGAAAVALPGFAVGHVQPLRAIVAPAAPVAPARRSRRSPPSSRPRPVARRSPRRRPTRSGRAPIRAMPGQPAVRAAPSEGELAALAAMAEVRAEADIGAAAPAIPGVVPHARRPRSPGPPDGRRPAAADLLSRPRRLPRPTAPTEARRRRHVRHASGFVRPDSWPWPPRRRRFSPSSRRRLRRARRRARRAVEGQAAVRPGRARAADRATGRRGLGGGLLRPQDPDAAGRRRADLRPARRRGLVPRQAAARRRPEDRPVGPARSPINPHLASNVAFRPDGPNRWRGEVEPFDDTFTVYLMVQRRPDGTLGAFIRNPERNLGVFCRADRLERRRRRRAADRKGPGRQTDGAC